MQPDYTWKTRTKTTHLHSRLLQHINDDDDDNDDDLENNDAKMNKKNLPFMTYLSSPPPNIEYYELYGEQNDGAVAWTRSSKELNEVPTILSK